jgi:hypothetical protein
MDKEKKVRKKGKRKKGKINKLRKGRNKYLKGVQAYS